MKAYDAKHIKNIAVVGHGGDGKTTLVEAFLYDAGAIERMGRVEDGNTTTDFDPEETRRGISLSAALAPLEWKNFKLNLIDVPGYFDFVGESTQAYHLADSALIVINASAGLEVGAEKAYAYCKKHNKPMVFVVNQMDREHADYAKVIDELRTKFGSAITPVQVPIGSGDDFKGYVDLTDKKAYLFKGNGVEAADVPADITGVVDEYNEIVIDNAASSVEELMERYFEGEELSKKDILRGLSEGARHGDIYPVYACSAAKNLGVREILDELIHVVPSAADAPTVEAEDAKGEIITIERDANGPFAAQIMKTIADQFVGKINLFKVLRGTFKASTSLYNTTAGEAEKFSNVTIMRGKNLINVDEIQAGDIGALAKLQYSNTGDTLTEAGTRVTFAPIAFEAPSISLAVTAKKQGEEEKVFAGLRRLEEEDPTLSLQKHPETGDMLLSGMGEMHIEVVCQKLKNKFGVEASLSDPKVPYRETIRKAAEAEGRHKKQSGGAGQYGVVNIRFEPLYDSDVEFEFVNAIVGGVVPREFIPAVEKGLLESMKQGVLAGYPMVNVKATLFDGKYHPVDSKEVAFRSAARLAYRAACVKADPTLLEPIGKVEVLIPDDYMGDIIGDLNRRRGRILGMNPQEEGQQVVAEVPMSEMVKYATDLRSMTQARGSFVINFERYEEMPANMAEKVISEAKFVASED
ncbi:MAG: elongation factor G [Christensenellaceae bacterium]|jgi:elongation factor G